MIDETQIVWQHRVRNKRNKEQGWSDWREGKHYLSAYALELMDVEERALFTSPTIAAQDIADILADLPVDSKGMCRWSDVANVVDALRRVTEQKPEMK